MSDALFAIGEETTHVVGDPACPRCLENYPAPCDCGGLVHAAAGDRDPDGTEWPATRCDRCGRSVESAE